LSLVGDATSIKSALDSVAAADPDTQASVEAVQLYDYLGGVASWEKRSANAGEKKH
jgi:hypothetical protein